MLIRIRDSLQHKAETLSVFLVGSTSSKQHFDTADEKLTRGEKASVTHVAGCLVRLSKRASDSAPNIPILVTWSQRVLVPDINIHACESEGELGKSAENGL